MGNRQLYTNASDIESACEYVGLPEETTSLILQQWEEREGFELWPRNLQVVQPKKGDILYDGQWFTEVTSVNPPRARREWEPRGKRMTGEFYGLILPREKYRELKQALWASARANPEIRYASGGSAQARLFNLVTAKNVLQEASDLLYGFDKK